VDRCRTSVGTGNDPAEIVTPTRRFGLLEITSGLPDDSREEDKRATERRLRDLRGRVKAARAAVSGSRNAKEVLLQDWIKAAHFYGRFGITETLLRHGVPGADSPEGDLAEVLKAPCCHLEDLRGRKSATFPR